MNKILVKTEWNEDSSMLVVTSDHIPGFVAEACTANELESKLSTMISGLLQETIHSNDTDNTKLFVNKEIIMDKLIFAAICLLFLFAAISAYRNDVTHYDDSSTVRSYNQTSGLLNE